ncbi:MAG: single-stranded DNA-binding protein [Clostridium sp.]|uniref:single-stranded DNA-binding protein n=1 Tax=Bacillati TaxID=1783272 RepID=UPI0026E98423|nr:MULTISPECIES: single-stranded DNA-binding protein [Terrabacteria group]MDU1096553.1 single-stranded DNA-binding protein [Clostridioides difficile]MBS6556135.1 single-stranded DNA-binding protein [Collinsella stercoris]MDU1127202.1 single-stranded DNA-binding protein [Clostridium sp.]MDU3678295.1 single-stranded DNA-binding protein [Clostridium sp.]MDU5739594.1 single-stranded DNA-binding protein [Clostridium sp.]
MNNVSLLGRCVADPELTYTAGNGTAVCKFRLAVNRIKKGEVDFIPCVAFGKAAETIATYVKKGNQFAVTGKIQTGSYEAQDGSKRYTTDVIVTGFDFVSSGQASNQGNSSNDPFGAYDDITPVDDGDMPF